MPTVVFDVNETLLNLDALDPHFEAMFGDATIKRQWFQQLLQNSLVSTILGTSSRTDFGQLGRQALEIIAMRQGVSFNDDHIRAIMNGMLELPPHEDVLPAIERLHEAGIALAALTNSSQQAAETQLNNAGIAQYLDMIMSVQGCGLFKPAIEVYRMAQDMLGESPDGLWMVAAHDWDIQGALHAGWSGAFVARPGKVYHPAVPQPNISAADLGMVVDALLRKLA